MARLPPNLPNMEAAFQRLAGLDGVLVTAGVQGVDAQLPEGETTLLTVAATNEFGDDEQNIPSRPWLRTSLDTHRERWGKLAGRVIKARGSGGSDGLPQIRLLAVAMAGDVKDTLNTGPWEPNAPKTIALKGSDQPLIDTGRLVQSQRAMVEMPDGSSYLVG